MFGGCERLICPCCYHMIDFGNKNPIMAGWLLWALGESSKRLALVQISTKSVFLYCISLAGLHLTSFSSLNEVLPFIVAHSCGLIFLLSVRPCAMYLRRHSPQPKENIKSELNEECWRPINVFYFTAP